MTGPSPRARGSRTFNPVSGRGGGSIPAGAGKPCSGCRWCAPTSVHPRGRGEASHVSTLIQNGVNLNRSSTTTCRGIRIGHRRQEPLWTSVRGAGVKAVSPAKRGRSGATRLDGGEHTRSLMVRRCHRRPQYLVVDRSPDSFEFTRAPTHVAGPLRRRPGPSPRARGSRGDRRGRLVRAGSIPAGAGKPSIRIAGRSRLEVHPRGRGEAVAAVRHGGGFGGPSPRARGSPPAHRRHLERRGSIPAGAGKPRTSNGIGRRNGVHPRGRGEAVDWPGLPKLRQGPSPRARGSPNEVQSPLTSPRSIPAGAGKPSARRSRRRATTVHPRGRGEALDDEPANPIEAGPSPRARGSPRNQRRPPGGARSIPAGAGKP